MSIQDLKDLILGWIPDNVMRLISPQRARNAYYSIIEFFWDITGDKSELETTDKSSLVNAINELKYSNGFVITEKILTNGQSFLFPAMSKGEAFVIRIIEYDGSSQEGIPSPDGMVWLGGYDGVGVGNDTVVICVSNSVGGSYSDVGYQFVIINQGKDSEVIFVDELPDENLARTGVIYILNSNNAMYIWDSQQSDYVLIGDVIPGTLISSTVFEDENNNVVIPEPNKLYFDTTTEEYYRWDGSSYVPIISDDGSNLTLEEARQNGNVFEGNVVTELEVGDFLTKSLVSKEYVDDVTSGFITTESDPIFTASPAFGITNTDINNWNAKGVQLTADQPTAKIHLRDSAGNIISTLDVGFLNNEGTTISFNSTTDEIELRNDDDELLSSFPASALMTGVGYGLNLTGSTLELLDSANNAIDSVTLTIANIQGLQTALDDKALKTTQITAGTGLTGGGNLSSNRTIGLSTSTQSDIAKGVTAYSWGNHADAGYLTTETDPTVPSHVKAITTADISNWDTAYSQRIQNLTTTGSSGAATFTGNTLNIPNYTLSGLGGVPLTRNITINGVTQDLSANRTWNIAPDYSALTNDFHVKKTSSGLADSNTRDTISGIAVDGDVHGKGFIGRSITVSVGGSYVVDFNDMAEQYNLTMTGNTSITFDNMITEDETVVITLTVTGNYSLVLPSFLVASFENDDYDGSMNNEIVINIKRGGANPQGYYTLKSYEI